MIDPVKGTWISLHLRFTKPDKANLIQLHWALTMYQSEEEGDEVYEVDVAAEGFGPQRVQLLTPTRGTVFDCIIIITFLSFLK